MLTALSVARDCGIVPFGQRVIVASAHPPQFSTPAQLYYMHANNPVTSSDTAGDVQRITNITSITNLEATDFESNNSYTLCSSPNDYFKQAFSRNNPSNYCFVMTGKTWALARTYFPEIIPKLVTRGAVFARMNPDQKQHLVQELQQLGYYVAMCGDGANDCGALKAAHAGISLSDAESSVASPFTSKNPDISCVPEVLKMTWFIITNPHSPSVPNWEKTDQVLFQAYWIWPQPVYCFSLEFNPERLMLASVTYRCFGWPCGLSGGVRALGVLGLRA
ncbi:unnamed protein product [Timema podura]|uniref:Uncharacterized protein n=1 Tax=Timema podura TaxID=61482 RepID=A0ABN7NW45_TIMPD|nr:unnamed protein product [Timema podura]